MGAHKLPKFEKSNVIFVRELMEVNGPLGEAFIIEAIRYYSSAIVAAPPAEDKPESFINPKAWQEIAKDVDKKMRERYESGRNAAKGEAAQG